MNQNNPFLVSQVRGTPLNNSIYCITTRDFRTYSERKLLIDLGFHCIDATIAMIGKGRYVMVLKDETAWPAAHKDLRVVTATMLERLRSIQ